MWILLGTVSGKKARTSVTLSKNMCGGSLTLRGVGGYSITPLKQVFSKYVSTVGGAHDSVGLYTSSINNVLIAASTDALAFAETVTEYKIDTTITPDWTTVNPSPILGNRLSFGFKQSPTISMHDVVYDHDAPYHDSIDWIGEYSTPSGSISVVGTSYVSPVVDTHIEIPIHVDSLVDDWIIIPVIHLVPVYTPEGCSIDFTSKIKGTNPFTIDELKQHTLTIFRKKLTYSDVLAGSIIIVAMGA